MFVNYNLELLREYTAKKPFLRFHMYVYIHVALRRVLMNYVCMLRLASPCGLYVHVCKYMCMFNYSK